MKSIDIPSGYKPPKKYVVCSNIFIDSTAPIVVFGTPLFLISITELTTKLWLYTIGKSHSKVAIDGNDIINKRYSFQRSGEEVKVFYDLKLTMIYSYSRDGDSVTISYMDFTHMGLNIRGNSAALNLGTNTMSGNEIIGARYGINID